MLNLDELKKIRDYIDEKTGIFIEDDILTTVYKRKIENFMKENDFDLFSDFFHALQDRAILQDFINIITINESYFFREKHQFDVLVKYVLPELDTVRPSSDTINILSSPCSSGEEIYTIAMVIKQESPVFHKRDFSLVGIDINSFILQMAKKGVYNSRSVMAVPKTYLDTYFHKMEDGYLIDKEFVNNVEFHNINVMDYYAMRRLGVFDIIFSRNMLIYFSSKARKSILSTYYSMLKPGGYLFLGHAEQIPKDMDLFKQINIQGTTLYKKLV
ncbi:CheR family methyltransferase [Nitratiruptor sp. SB155-2]|uniref:CheR family methyltransferase n=1 Tax=Nitratiruptor sp. (strain SB155-2) TaxID=387092 RepID=UPI0001587052|nr:CheR family methyltransferase [Nitratiruptor sp. SB155-2]BAF69976.1 chemotaxis protein methyltransferase [Nitratiruptor sp. SB155-2]